MYWINTFENWFVSDENYVIGTHFDKNMFSIIVDVDMQPHLLSKNIRPDERVEVSFDFFGMSTFRMLECSDCNTAMGCGGNAVKFRVERVEIDISDNFD